MWKSQITSAMSLHCWILLLPSLYRGVLCSAPCGVTEYLVREESADILLRVDKPGVKDISWVSRSTLLAITKPGEPVEVKVRHLRGRLHSGTNGSLNLTQLTKEDQGEIVANVHFHQEEQNCNQNYNLTVYSKLSAGEIKIHHNVTVNGTCRVTLTCAIDKPDASVSWSDSLSGAVRRSATVQLTALHANSSWTCTASHPLANVSRTIAPLELCHTANKREVLSVALGVASSLLMVVIICCFLRRHKNICKRMKWKKPSRSRDDLQQLENIYCEIDQSKEFGSKTDSAQRTGHVKINAVYMTSLRVPEKPAYKRGNLLEDGDMYSD